MRVFFLNNCHKLTIVSLITSLNLIMQDQTPQLEHENMPQPIGKETSHSLKYILALAFFLAWTGLVGFVGYQLKVVVDYIEGPEAAEEVNDEVDDEEEVEDSLVIEEDGDAVVVEYDYEKYAVTTELATLFGSDAEEYCYRFDEGVGNIEERIQVDTYIDVPEYEPEGGWLALDAFESPRPERDSRSITHYCKLDVLGPSDIITYHPYGYESGDDTLVEDLLGVLGQDELIKVEDGNLDTWLASTLITDDASYLVYAFADAGFGQWRIYEIVREFVNVNAVLVESCNIHDSFDVPGSAILECDIYGDIVTEELSSDEE